MNSNIAIKVENVSKSFRIPHEKVNSLPLGGNMKEGFMKSVLNNKGKGMKLAFFGLLTGISEFAIINLLKPPVLTARHGGVLFCKIKT